VTEVDGIDEVVDRNIKGIVVSKDIHLLALAIITLCNNPSLARKFW
jgi:glycosyltransferase involved in cell wall biosynthesis